MERGDPAGPRQALRAPSGTSGRGYRFSTAVSVWTLSWVCVAVLLFLAVTRYFGRRAEAERTALVLDQAITLLQERIWTRTSMVSRWADLAALMTPRRALRAEDVEALLPGLARVFLLNGDLSHLAFALESTGEFWLLNRTQGREVHLQAHVRDPDRGIRVRDFRWDGDAFRPESESVWDGYDPRARPHYLHAVRSARPSWTLAYRFWGRPEQPVRRGVSYVVPIRESGGALIGVWESDLDSETIARIVQGPGQESSVRSFLFERDGDGWKPVFEEAVDAGLFAAVRPALNGLAKDVRDTVLGVEVGGLRHLVRVRTIDERGSPRWLIGTSMPQTALSRDHEAQNRWLWRIALAMFAVAVPGAVLLSRLVSSPLRALERRMADGAGADWEPGPDGGGPVELRWVAEAFGWLVHDVRKQRDELTAMNARLKDEVAWNARHLHEIEATQHRFLAAFTNSPVAKLLLRHESGRIETANAAAESLLSARRESVAGRSMAECGLVDEGGGRDLSEAIRGRRRLRDCEVRFIGPSGRQTDCLAYLEPVLLDEAPMLLLALVDVSERRVAVEAVRDSERRLRRLNEVSLEINRTVSGRTTDPAEACRILTRVAGEALGVSRVSAWRLDRNRGVMVCIAAHCAAGGSEMAGSELSLTELPGYFLALGEGRVIAASDALSDPRTREMRAYLLEHDLRSMLDAPVRQRGDLIGVVCLEQAGEARCWTADEESFAGNLADLVSLAFEASDRAAAEEQLRQLNATLEQRVAVRTAELMAANGKLKDLDRLKSEFVATMSHELRTPLNSIIGFTGIIKAGMAGPVTPEQRRQLEMVYGSAGHLLNLINDLLDLSRIESGRIDMDVSAFDAEAVLEEVAALLQPAVRAKGLLLVVSAEGPLPLRTDRKRLFQVVLNLANNAVKFTEHGTVTMSAAFRGERFEVVVADTGVGIRPESQGMLFEAFRQVDGSARRMYEGTGLGLYLCRKLVTMLGGEITVESEFGKGSRFAFVIPRAIGSPETGQ